MKMAWLQMVATNSRLDTAMNHGARSDWTRLV
jgi:hypothetical protein